MKTRLTSSRRAALVFLAASLTFSTPAAPQLVTALNSGTIAPANGNGDSWAPIISPDGRFVFFASTADNLVAIGGSNGVPRLNPPVANVYLRDRLNGTTTLVSVNLAGNGGGDGNSFPTGLSTNGQFALFESTAQNLVTNRVNLFWSSGYITNNVQNVFWRDLVHGVTRLVNEPTNSQIFASYLSSTGGAWSSTMTPDGRYVAFVSPASNLTPNDTNGIPDVFVRDTQSNTTTLVSVGASSTARLGYTLPGSSEAPEITPDGRFVAFSSTATNLVPGVTTTNEIYVRDLQTGTTFWASTNARAISGFGVNGFCYNPAISDDGRFVAFEISSNNVLSGYPGTNGFVLRCNLQSGLTDLVASNAVYPSGATPDTRSLNLSPDGRFIAYAANSPGGGSSVLLWDAQTGTNILASANLTNGITTGAFAYWPDVDATGRYVVFYSTDTNLVPNDAVSGGIFVRDVQAGVTALASVDTNGNPLAVDPIAVPALSAGGGSVAFESPWANFDGRNFESDVFARDLAHATSELISVHAPNLPSLTPNGPSALWPGSVSTNGRFIAFSSWANNLAPKDTNSRPDVFVRDFILGETLLVSIATNGFAGNNFSLEPSLSGSGRYVAFTSAATDLVAGDTNQATDVFVRDLPAGTNMLVSVSTNGGFGNGDSYLPTISSDGRYVLFYSKASNLASGTAAGDNLFLRDCQSNQTYALTTGGCVLYSMTPDGQAIAFVGAINSVGPGTNLYVWNSPSAALIFTNTSAAITNVSISPDGHWVAYTVGNSLLAQNLIAGTNCLVAAGGFSPRAGLKFSGDDRYLVYAGTNDVYRHDFQFGTDLLVSHAVRSTNAANGPSDSPVISSDGRFVAFRSVASNLVDNDTSGVPQIYVSDCRFGLTAFASTNQNGAADNRSLTPVFSNDGQMLVFQSWASDSTTRDFNLGDDVFALDVFPLTTAFPNPTPPPPPLVAKLVFTANDLPGPVEIPAITWPIVSEQSYSVQYKNDLNDPVWQNLNGPVSFLGSQAYFSDLTPAAGQRFYRVVRNR